MSAGHHHARVRKLTGLSLLANDKPWKVSYSVDTRYPGIMTVVGTSYHHTQPEALADAIEWTDGWAGKEHTMPDQVETRIENIRQYNQDILADENTRADDADKADDTLWLIDQLTATRQSIRDARTQEQEDQEVNRIDTGFRNSTASGEGRALCECGALSEELPSRNKRAAWHRAHKTEIRNQAKETR